MPRNFYVSFEKIDGRRQPHGGGTDTAGGLADIARSRDDSNVIRLPALRSSPAARSTWTAFGRSPFLPADAKPAFPPFNLKTATIDVICAVFGLFFLSALVASLPLAILILWMLVSGG